MSQSRPRKSPSEIQAILAALDASALSCKKFARENGLSYHSLYSWRKRFKSGAPSSRRQPVLKRVHVAASAGGSGLELELPGGIKLRVPVEYPSRELAAHAKALLAACSA